MSRESMEFKAEVRDLMDLMIHSLYSHREIFLREIISNASDAIDKARYAGLTDPKVLEGRGEFKIKLTIDKAAGTLTVSDNGIGMGREDAVRELGTIAHSGTRRFADALKSGEAKDKPELIGQFGVGFYSAFMVADTVTVVTRRDGEAGVRWESKADGTFNVDDSERAAGGTDVILHMKDDAKEFLEPWEVRKIVRKYSDYIEHPIVMDTEVEKPDENDPDKKTRVIEEETLNTRRAIWLRRKGEVTDGEYTEFYHHIAHDFEDPAATIHFRAEGTSEFSALLFVPARAPMDIYYKDFKVGPMLYVKRVQIMNNCEALVPPYLRFLRGVVDSSDLPLNVSREMLQSNRQADVIKNNIIKRVLEALKDLKTNDAEKYTAFHKQLGRVLKEGVHYDTKRKESVAELLMYESTETKPGEYTDLDQYIGRMKPDQEEVYYIIGPNRQEIEKSPYLESFRAKGFEVLLLIDEVDDIIMGSLSEYKGKRLKSVSKGDIKLDKEAKPEEREKFAKVIEFARDRLKDKVKDVRISGRLKDSPCCLVGEEGEMDHNLEKLLKSLGQDVPANKKVLELNPGHALFASMNRIFEANPDDARIGRYVDLLYGQALLFMGLRPDDPVAFARDVTALMVENAKD